MVAWLTFGRVVHPTLTDVLKGSVLIVGVSCLKSHFLGSIENKMESPRYSRLSPTHKQAMSLESAWKSLTKEAHISSLGSSAPNVFCTPNFLVGIAESTASLDDYLRPVDAALAFANGDMLLLSEREANGVLLAVARSRDRGQTATLKQPNLIHLSYAGSEQGGQRMSTNPLMREAVSHARRGRGTQRCAALARIWVFGGTTTIPDDGRDAVKVLVKGKRSAVKHIVAARGYAHMLHRSVLDILMT